MDDADIVDVLRNEADRAKPASARETMRRAAQEIERLRADILGADHEIRALRLAATELPF